MADFRRANKARGIFAPYKFIEDQPVRKNFNSMTPGESFPNQAGASKFQKEPTKLIVWEK